MDHDSNEPSSQDNQENVQQSSTHINLGDLSGGNEAPAAPSNNNQISFQFSQPLSGPGEDRNATSNTIQLPQTAFLPNQNIDMSMIPLANLNLNFSNQIPGFDTSQFPNFVPGAGLNPAAVSASGNLGLGITGLPMTHDNLVPQFDFNQGNIPMAQFNDNLQPNNQPETSPDNNEEQNEIVSPVKLDFSIAFDFGGNDQKQEESDSYQYHESIEDEQASNEMISNNEDDVEMNDEHYAPYNNMLIPQTIQLPGDAAEMPEEQAAAENASTVIDFNFPVEMPPVAAAMIEDGEQNAQNVVGISFGNADGNRITFAPNSTIQQENKSRDGQANYRDNQQMPDADGQYQQVDQQIPNLAQIQKLETDEIHEKPDQNAHIIQFDDIIMGGQKVEISENDVNSENSEQQTNLIEIGPETQLKDKMQSNQSNEVQSDSNQKENLNIQIPFFNQEPDQQSIEEAPGQSNNQISIPMEIEPPKVSENSNLLIQLPETLPLGNGLPEIPQQLQDAQPELVANLNAGDLQNQIMIPMQQVEFDELPEPEKKERKIKNRAHFNMCDFYNLRKVKCTLDFESPLSAKRLTRGQYIYTLDLKDEDTIRKLLEECKENQQTRAYIDFGLHIKQFKVQEIWLLKEEPTQAGKKKKYIKDTMVKLPNESPTYGVMQSLGSLRPSFINDKASEEFRSKTQAKSWYLTPKMQTTFWAKNLNQIENKANLNIQQDLNTLDYLQKDLCYYKESEQAQQERDEADNSFTEILGKKPELQISKFMTLKLKKQEIKNIIETQLKKTFKIMVNVGKVKKDASQDNDDGQECNGEVISNFGLRAIDYQRDNSLNSQSHACNHNHMNKLETYILCQDQHECSQLWLPQMFGTTRRPIFWTMNYIVPRETNVMSCGDLVQKRDIKRKNDDGSMSDDKSLFVFKSKPHFAYKNNLEHEMHSKFKIIPDKIGFIIGNFSHVSTLSDREAQLGSAFFINSQKMELFEQRNFYQKQVVEILEHIENMLKVKHPCKMLKEDGKQNQNALKLVFVPNLFLRKDIRQSLSFANCLHVFDEEVLLPRNVIEKRYKIYKIMATCLSYDYFGYQVYEESDEDAWLITSLRERIGDRYKRSKCGSSIYRYHILQTMEKFFNCLKSGAERFSLCSKYVPHFSELQYGEDLYYQKCQLIMHIIESILGETHFFNVTRELFNKSKPTVSLRLFKKVLKDIGIKFLDIQKNWIDSTSCPHIDCSYTFNRKNNSVTINLEQHSVMKQYFMFQKHIQDNKDKILKLCSNGKLLMESIGQESRDEIPSTNVDLARNCKRWFQGDIKVVIYQTDGSEISVQTQKVKLKQPKTKVSCSIPLLCKVRKANNNNKKRDDNILIDDYNNAQDQRNDEAKSGTFNDAYGPKRNTDGSKRTSADEQLHQMLNDDNQWRFELTEYEIEEFPKRGIKRLFEVKNIESPILWIRIDPDFEYIRSVKVQQERDNWLFQLLKEKDHISQIEACKELANYNEEFVYEILEAVAKNPKFFFKVRKHALRSLEVIQVATFSKFLSHEKSFLIEYYNQRNFSEKIGFYKSNDFQNTLEYYVNTYLLRSIAKSKEQKLMVREDILKIKQKALKDLTASLKGTDLEIDGLKASLGQQLGISTINFNYQNLENDGSDYQDESDMKNEERKQSNDEQQIDMREYSITSNLICNLMIRLLKENDNSENAFDDCFLIGKILSNMGKMDNFIFMPQVAQEIQRQFNLDKIGKFSSQFSVTKGAIKGYYNMRKQIYKFTQLKQPYLDCQAQDDIEHYTKCIRETELILDQMNLKLQSIFTDKTWPLEIRTFLYQKKIKNDFIYTKKANDKSHERRGDAFIPPSITPEEFLNPLYHNLKFIQNVFSAYEFEFGSILLQILAKFLESNFVGKLNFKECLIPNDEKCKVIAKMLWYIMGSQPANFLDFKISHWTKRIYNCIFIGSNLPLPLEFEHQHKLKQTPFPVEYDQSWHDTEVEQQIHTDQQEVQKQQNQNVNFQNNQKDNKSNIQNDNMNSQSIGNINPMDNFMHNMNKNFNIEMNFMNDPVSSLNPMQMDQQPNLLQMPSHQMNLMVGANTAANMALNTAVLGDFNHLLGQNDQSQNLVKQSVDNIISINDTTQNDANQNFINIKHILDKAQAKGDINKIIAGNQMQTDDIIEDDLSEQNTSQDNGGNSNVINLDFTSLMQQTASNPAPPQVHNNTSILDFNQVVPPQFNAVLGPPLTQDQLMGFPQDNNDVAYLNTEIKEKKKKKDKKKKKRDRKEYGSDQENPSHMPETFDELRDGNVINIGVLEPEQVPLLNAEYKPITYDEWPVDEQPDQNSDDEMVIQEEIDDFPDHKYDILWQQKCWDILYILYFDSDSGVFVQEISQESMGTELFYDYLEHIKAPINFLMIKQKMIQRMYGQPGEFVMDMTLCFDNCLQFHKRGSPCYKQAQKMKKKLNSLVKERNVMKHQNEQVVQMTKDTNDSFINF